MTCLAAPGCTAAPLWLWDYRCEGGHLTLVPHCAGCHRHELTRRALNFRPPCPIPHCTRPAWMRTARQLEVTRG